MKLKDDSIDVWHGVIKKTDKTDQFFWNLLDATEQQTALKLKKSEMQARYVEIHGKVRKVLAHYLNQEADKIVINREHHGKPFLPEHPDWVFNLSHSDHQFAIAVAKKCRLGIDIEIVKKRLNMFGLAQKCLADEEYEYWKSLPKARQFESFFQFWTRKEAFVKATGRGISVGLKNCVINPANPNEMLRVPDEFAPVECWRIEDIALDENVLCALAHDQEFKSIKLREVTFSILEYL